MADGQTTIIRGSRTKLVLTVVALGLATALMLWVSIISVILALTDPEQLFDARGRHGGLAPLMPLIAPVATGFLVFHLVRNAVSAIRLPRLEIGPSGLSLCDPWSARNWSWDQVEDFQFDPMKGRLTFNDRRPLYRGRLDRFPGYLDIGSRELFNLIVESKQRWGSPPLAQDTPSA